MISSYKIKSTTKNKTNGDLLVEFLEILNKCQKFSMVDVHFFFLSNLLRTHVN